MQFLKNNATNALMATRTAVHQGTAHNNDEMADQEAGPLPQTGNAQLPQAGNAQLLPQKSKVCFNIIQGRICNFEKNYGVPCPLAHSIREA